MRLAKHLIALYDHINKFNNTEARMLDSIDYIAFELLFSGFWV